MHNKNNIFEIYKSDSSYILKNSKPDNIYFQLFFEGNKAFLKVIDERNNIVFPDKYLYSDETFNILNELEHIIKEENLNLSWTEKNNKNNLICLYKHENLINKLLKSDRFIDSKFNIISYDEHLEELEIYLLCEGRDIVSTNLVINFYGKIIYKPLIINRKFAFSNGKIYKIKDIGINFLELNNFETLVNFSDFRKFLSIYFSKFENVKIIYEDYNLVFDNNKRFFDVSLNFSKFTKNNYLEMKISKYLSEYDTDFLENYRLNKYVYFDDENKNIIVKSVFDTNYYDYYQELEKILNRYSKLLNKNNNYFSFENTFVVEEELAKQLILKELHYLYSRFIIIGEDILKRFNIKTVNPKLNFSSVSSGIDFLEGDAILEIESELINLNNFMLNYSKNSYITLKDGTFAIVNKSYIDKIKRLFRKTKNNNIKISIFDLPLIENLVDKEIYSDLLSKYKKILDGFNNIESKEIKIPQLKTTLRNYQLMGLKWLYYLCENNLGGCLADDMGLGKTVQAIALLSLFYPENNIPSLIVMPKSLLFNWENEINKFNPNISFYSYNSTNRNINEAVSYNLILTTYSMLRNDIDSFRNKEFLFTILDESQNIKNPNSQISRAVSYIKTKYRFCLSGTPIENNLTELYSLFRFLNPSMFPSFDEFNRYYIQPIQRDNNKEVSLELRKKVYPFILRRIKKDVLKELPEKIEQTLYVEMSEEQRKLYEETRLFFYKNIKEHISYNGIKKAQLYIFQALNELRQISCIPEIKSENKIISPKREILMDNIPDIIENNHKVLIFANFINAVDLISKDLKSRNIKHLTMTGSTRDRKDIIETFQNDKDYKVLVMTLKTGGLGLNLTAADFVFIYDPWWNKSAENQAIDRTHRIGQDKTVFSYKIIVKKSIEEKILQLQDRKIELFDSIISHDSSSLKTIEEEDIEFILGS
ncbi:MAG: helicase SNF [Candidatus Sericytochromatia bacterium]|nr:MAG: helicase SNF [Candidatus Sericytochromatia bacterium]